MHLFAEVELNYGLQAPYWLRDSVLLWLCKIDYFSMLKFVLVAEIENKDELGGLLEWWKLMFLTTLTNLTGLFLAFCSLLDIESLFIHLF